MALSSLLIFLVLLWQVALLEGKREGERKGGRKKREREIDKSVR